MKQISSPNHTNNEQRSGVQIEPRVVWVVAQLLADIPTDAINDGLPEPWKGVTARLAHLPVDERLLALERELKSIPGVDPEEFGKLIFAADPQAPAEQDTAEGTPFPFSSIYREKRETESHAPTVFSLGEFLGQEDAPISWCVEQILPVAGVGILAGPGGYGKSWMLLDLAIECARGGQWLGHFPTGPGRVLYLDEESTPALLRHRTRKLLKGKKIDETQGLDVHFGVGLGICLDDSTSVQQLERIVGTLRPNLIIIDSLIRVHRAEENSASEMSRVFAVVKSFVQKYDCAILIADHQRKPAHYGTSLDLLVRGSTDKVAFVDTLLSLQRKDKALIVEHSKSRFAEPISPFVVRIEDPSSGSTVVLYAGDADAVKQAARQEEVREFLETAIPPGEWVPRQTLVAKAKEAGIGVKALDDTLKELLVSGAIRRDDRKPEDGRGGKAAHYSWMPPGTSFHVSPPYRGETETETGKNDCGCTEVPA